MNEGVDGLEPDAVVANATLERLPKYLAYLKIKQKQGISAISSTRIAEDLRLNPVLVRKDLAAVCQAGRPRTGFPIEILIDDVEQYLGYHNTREAFLVGAGHLGQALLGYKQFAEYGLSILAAFDVSPRLIGRECNGRPIMAMKKLPDLAQRMGVQIAILTVPGEAAQPTCDLLVQCGMRAIWNFTPVMLEVPDRIILHNENLATSFAVLSRKLTTALYTKEKDIGGEMNEHHDR